mgnify:CR=1 FL=1
MRKWMGVLLAAGGLALVGCAHDSSQAGHTNYSKYEAPATDNPMYHRGPGQSEGGTSTAPQSNMPGAGGTNYSGQGAQEATPESAPPPAPILPPTTP